MKITVGHTPDSDDAFMFYGMLAGGMPSHGFEVEHVVEGIEELNKKAISPKLDVTAVSVHACAYIPGYTILRSGGSFGLGYGPIVVAGQEMDIDGLRRAKIAIPGKMTSAFLLLQIMIGRFEHVEMEFSRIPEAVHSGAVDAGVVIHETQLSYLDEGVRKIFDLGEWWDQTTGGLPVPLGVNVMRTGLGDSVISEFDRYLRDSIEYGLRNSTDAIEYAMQYSRGKSREMIERFVRMYVNENTVDMGDAGEESIRTLFKLASDKGLMDGFSPRIAGAA